jgi:hypothetical protein
MSDAQDQIERVLKDSDIPADDATAEEPMASDPHPDRTQENTRASFSRMRTGWVGDDARMIMELEALSDQIIRRRFAVAFAIIERVYAHVRIQAVNKATGELLVYEDGTPQWEKDEWDAPVEDWAMLGDNDRSNLLHTIAVHMFEWELAKGNTWFEAMVAKGQWEEIFSRGYTSLPGHVASGKPTIEDRTHHSQKNAAQERYFALFESSLSRKADGIVRAMTGIQKVLMETRAW